MTKLLVAAVIALAASHSAQSAQRWDFNEARNAEQWTVPSDMNGAVLGGSLWLTLNPREVGPQGMLRDQIFGELNDRLTAIADNQVSSPQGLNVKAASGEQLQVKLRVLNLSPVTDLLIRWRAQGEPWKPGLNGLSKLANTRHCAIRPDLKAWQDLVCYLDPQWPAAVDQLALFIPQRVRGDLWIDSVEIASGAPEPAHAHPDIASARVIPTLTVPGLSQTGFAQAFAVLEANMVTDVPFFGFTYPFMTPGGAYAPGGWWLMDTPLAAQGARWANPRFAENVMRGFRDVQSQNPDGRIDLWGWSASRGQPGDISQFPEIFQVQWDIARATPDARLRAEIYQSMAAYLDWWLSPVKRDARTKLVTGTFEETLGDRHIGPGMTEGTSSSNTRGVFRVAPVDLNVAVAIGARRTAQLAAALGRKSDAARYESVFNEFRQAINDTLWDDEDGAYYNYDLAEQRLRKRLLISTFNPLRLGIAPADRRARLLKRLLDPAQFNWGGVVLTGMAKTEPDFIEAKGVYDGRGWWGDAWTFLLMHVIEGLEDADEPELAAQVNWQTIRAFHDNYYELLLPSTGEGQGQKGFSWTAAEYIHAIVHHLFGVEVDTLNQTLRISPRIPRELYGKELALKNLVLPTSDTARVSVHIVQTSPTAATVRVDFSAPPPPGQLVVTLPGSPQQRQTPLKRSFETRFR